MPFKQGLNLFYTRMNLPINHGNSKQNEDNGNTKANRDYFWHRYRELKNKIHVIKLSFTLFGAYKIIPGDVFKFAP